MINQSYFKKELVLVKVKWLHVLQHIINNSSKYHLPIYTKLNDQTVLF